MTMAIGDPQSSGNWPSEQERPHPDERIGCGPDYVKCAACGSVVDSKRQTFKGWEEDDHKLFCPACWAEREAK
jgi:hypothetical protein